MFNVKLFNMTDRAAFKLTRPLPGRNAFAALQEQLFEHLQRTAAEPGTPFYSENELTRITGLSRNTVRKSLDELVRAGWIERRQGTGTFVGTRALTPKLRRPAAVATAARDRSSDMLRLGVLLGMGAGHRTSWYTMEVLHGLESAATTQRLNIELLGMTRESEHLRHRIRQTRPDVLACLAPDQSWAMLIAEAVNQNIPVMTTGTRLLGMGVPTICEENVDSTKAAVRYLVEHGHRNIAFIQDALPARFAMDRYRGYVQGMADCGLEAEPELTLWTRQEGDAPVDERVAKFLARRHATALLVGTAGVLRFVMPAIAAAGLRVPDDLSILSFDQAALDYGRPYGITPTIMALPLEQMGHTLARYARMTMDGQPVPEMTVLPCDLIEGSTVARFAAAVG